MQPKRKSPRFETRLEGHWDYFSYQCGIKRACIENVSSSGCLLRSVDPIEPGRWVRLVIRADDPSVSFTAIGRIVHQECRMESWMDRRITLFRCGVEFNQALNASLLSHVEVLAQERPGEHPVLTGNFAELPAARKKSWRRIGGNVHTLVIKDGLG